MDKIKAAVVGTGMMGQIHGDAIRRFPYAKLVASADPNGSLQADSGSMGKIYADYHEMIEREKPDVVHVCTPNSIHFDVCKAALEEGCGVYCEKPLAIDSLQSAELIGLAERAEVPCAVNFNYRNNAMVQEMRQRIISGDAGDIFLVHGRYLQDWLMYDTDYSWRLDQKLNGRSRAVADIGSHWFDTAQCAAGSKIEAVYAKLFTAIPARKKPDRAVETFKSGVGTDYTEVAVDTEDGALIMTRFENGAMGSLLLSQVSGGHKNGLELELDCSNYSMSWAQEDADKLWVASRKEGKKLIYASPGTLSKEAARYALLPEGHAGNWRDAFYLGLKSFYTAILEGRAQAREQAYATFYDAHRIIRITEACMRSQDSGAWETV